MLAGGDLQGDLNSAVGDPGQLVSLRLRDEHRHYRVLCRRQKNNKRDVLNI